MNAKEKRLALVLRVMAEDPLILSHVTVKDFYGQCSDRGYPASQRTFFRDCHELFDRVTDNKARSKAQSVLLLEREIEHTIGNADRATEPVSRLITVLSDIMGYSAVANVQTGPPVRNKYEKVAELWQSET